MNRRYATVIVIGAALSLTGCASATSTTPKQVVAPVEAPAQAPSTAAAPTQPAKPPMAAIGQSVQDGNWAFVVETVKCGLSSLTYRPSKLVVRPQTGQFCVAVVKGTNISKQPQGMGWTLVTVADKQGNSYSQALGDSSMAAWNTYIGDRVRPGMDVNPGATGPQTYVYDLPAGVQPVSVELHGGPSADGAFVAVS